MKSDNFANFPKKEKVIPKKINLKQLKRVRKREGLSWMTAD